jgi:hypothetical protein
MTSSIPGVDIVSQKTPAGETRLVTNFKRLHDGEIYEVEIKIYFASGYHVILSPDEFRAVTEICAAVRSDETAWNRVLLMSTTED